MSLAFKFFKFCNNTVQDTILYRTQNIISYLFCLNSCYYNNASIELTVQRSKQINEGLSFMSVQYSLCDLSSFIEPFICQDWYQNH